MRYKENCRRGFLSPPSLSDFFETLGFVEMGKAPELAIKRALTGTAKKWRFQYGNHQ
jgi:hypothetical protein